MNDEDRLELVKYKELWQRHYEALEAQLRAKMELDQAVWYRSHLNDEVEDAKLAILERLCDKCASKFHS